MSRITAQASKLARSINCTSSVLTRPANGSKTAIIRTCGSSQRELAILHRPSPSPSPAQPARHPLTTSAAPRARADSSTIDFAVLPAAADLYLAADEGRAIRVPLLPDTHLDTDARAAHHAPEAEDAPSGPPPEILVVAANPEHVLPSALTEVGGIGHDGVELGFAHEPMARGGAEEGGQAMLKDLWKGLVDDIFGPEKPKTAV